MSTPEANPVSQFVKNPDDQEAVSALQELASQIGCNNMHALIIARKLGISYEEALNHIIGTRNAQAED